MVTNKLRYFCTIAETGSMRKASELLRISPPALSKAIRLLESDLGMKLVNRSGRNIIITKQGRNLATKSAELIQAFDRLREDTERSEVHHKEIRIATFEVFSTYALSFLKNLDWNERPLVFHEVLPGELERKLIEGQVDIGITYMPVPMPEVEYLKVCSIQMGVFALKTAFPGVEQMKLPFVVPVMPLTGTPTRVRGLDGWPEDAYPRRVRYRVTLMETALELCRQGRAAGFFPLFVVAEHNARYKEEYRLMRRPSPYPTRTCMADVYIVKRKGEEEDRVTKQLARAIRMVCKPKE